MRELIHLRNYKQKVFLLGKKKRRYEIHSGHIHYKNKNGQYVNSDIRFHKQVNGTWVMNQHNYFFSCPEYSDEIFDFYNGYKETNHSIKLRPLTEHVKGTKDEEGNILYQDAFGKGVDFKACLLRSGVCKLITIKEHPGKDMVFDFELILDGNSKHLEQEEYDKKEKKFKSFKIDIDKNKDLNLTGKRLKFGKDNKFSYVKNALVWDSNENELKRENVKLTVFEKNGKKYLRKFIPKEYFDNAVFPVFTDHPTDYYGDNADGLVGRSDNLSTYDWADLHDNVIGTSVRKVDTAHQYAISTAYQSTLIFINRGFFYFDTSGITESYVVDSATLKIYGYTKNDSGVSVQKGTQCDVLCLEDYDAFEGDMYTHVASWQLAYNEFEFNDAGKSDINRVGMTKLCCREYDYDYLNVDHYPPYHRNGCYYANNSGVDKDPLLIIETSPGEEEEPPPYQATEEQLNSRLEIRDNQTFELLKTITRGIKKVTWEYLRLGGCGRAQIPLAFSPEDIDDFISPDSEIRLYIDTSTQYNVLAYRGYIERYKTVIGVPDMVQLSAYGYSGQLNRKELIHEYEDVEISEIVKHILTNTVLPYTPITYDEEDIDTTDYACSMRFNTMPREALKTLAEIAGNYEWGVDVNMKFYFKKSSSTFEHFLKLKLEASSFDKMYDYAGIINRIVVKGGNDLEVTVNNTESQNLYGIRSDIVSNSAIISIGTAQRYGSMLLASKASIFHRAKIQKIKNQVLFESSLPLGRVAIIKEPVAFAEHTKYDEDIYGNFKYGGVISYVINKIRYMFTNEGTAATLDLGEPRPDIAVNLERLKFELNQIRNL